MFFHPKPYYTPVLVHLVRNHSQRPAQLRYSLRRACIHSPDPPNTHTHNYINLPINQSKYVTKFQTASRLRVSNFGLFHLGLPLCSKSILSPLLQLILQNWRMGRSTRVGLCCMFEGVSAVINCSTYTLVDVTNSHVSISQYLNDTALLCVVSLMRE